MTDYSPLVSIIINTHNSTEFLSEAIDSAFRQTYKNVEVIVYDNASTEDIQSCFGEYSGRIQYYRSDEYLTLGGARNAAMQLANGDLIDYLDADDVFLPNKLELQVPFFEKSETGLVYSDSLYLEQKDGVWQELVNDKKETKPSGFVFPELLKRNFIPFNTAIFRNFSRERNSDYYFKEKFEFCTDYELFLKISHKYEIQYVSQPTAKWRDHGGNITLKKRYLAPAERFLTLPAILEYEPDLFLKYKKSMNVYLSEMFLDMGKYFFDIKQTFRALQCVFLALLNRFSLLNLKIFVLFLLPRKTRSTTKNQ